MITHECRHFLQLVLWFSQVHVAIHMKNKLKTWNFRFDLMWLLLFCLTSSCEQDVQFIWHISGIKKVSTCCIYTKVCASLSQEGDKRHEALQEQDDELSCRGGAGWSCLLLVFSTGVNQSRAVLMSPPGEQQDYLNTLLCSFRRDAKDWRTSMEPIISNIVQTGRSVAVLWVETVHLSCFLARIPGSQLYQRAPHTVLMYLPNTHTHTHQ